VAYMCIYASNHECDGCDRCREEPEEEFDPRWDREYDNDDEYCERLEREEGR